MDKWSLSQRVNENTRKDQILELILTESEDDIVNTEIINNIELSDNNLILTKMNNDTTEEEDVEKEHFYSTVIPHYKVESMSEDHIVKAKQFLNNIDWTKTNVEHLQHKLEEMVTKFCEPRKKTKV